MARIFRTLLLLGMLLLVPQPAASESSVGFEQKEYAGHSFRVVRVNRADALRLFWRTQGIQRYRTLPALAATLEQRGLTLHFATNAGIFEPDFAPTGLHIEASRVLRPLNLQEGSGNFYLKPNGVFAVTLKGTAEIMPARAARGQEQLFRYALQSGPLLLSDRSIHPAFDPHSANMAIRSGIGIDHAQRVSFVLSNEPVSFYTLAAFFRDVESATSALYLDGAISEFHLPAAGWTGSSREFAGMIAVVSER